MTPQKRTQRLRSAGLTPTIQRVAVLEYLESTCSHPTADQVLEEVRRKHPSVSRATVYNALDALTKAHLILRLTVDPGVARYDADHSPHAHFRCRLCNTVYDIPVHDEKALGLDVDGHRVETVRTYAYGVCSACLKKTNSEGSLGEPTKLMQNASQSRSASSPDDTGRGGEPSA